MGASFSNQTFGGVVGISDIRIAAKVFCIRARLVAMYLQNRP
jgi:hypothetical protein